MKLRIWALLFVFVAIGLSQFREEPNVPMRYASRGTRGAIATGTGFASEAGMRLYHQGGNAVDAGVAATFAASVSEFSHFGFGGEAPILIRTAEGEVYSIAGVGTMPKLATAQFFREHELEPGEVRREEPGGVTNFVPVAGILPALVPGMVDAALVALREFGTQPLAEVMAPAIELADGMPLDEIRARSIIGNRDFFALWPTSLAVFFPDGRVPFPGQIFRQPDLARTMRAMVAAEQKALAAGRDRKAAIDAARDYFYRGEIARKIDEFSRANGGLLRYDDLAAFHLEPEQPRSVDYEDVTVYKTDFWGQGPVMLEMLNLLNGLDVGSMQHNSEEYIHNVTEAMKLAYADRDTYYADPRFEDVPADTLLSEQYAAERRGLITDRASMAFRPGRIGDNPPRHPSVVEMAQVRIDEQLVAHDTTCVNAADANGVMFSATPSGAWMPPVIAGYTGVALTQRAQSFLLQPDSPNVLEPGKRPRITLSPTLVTRGGEAMLALSTPGGDNQDQALLQLLLNVVDFGMSTEEAVEAPRFQTRHLVSSFGNHAMHPGELRIDERLARSVGEALQERGHRILVHSRWNGGAAPVMIRLLPSGVIEASADPFGYRDAQAW